MDDYVWDKNREIVYHLQASRKINSSVDLISRIACRKTVIEKIELPALNYLQEMVRIENPNPS